MKDFTAREQENIHRTLDYTYKIGDEVLKLIEDSLDFINEFKNDVTPEERRKQWRTQCYLYSYALISGLRLVHQPEYFLLAEVDYAESEIAAELSKTAHISFEEILVLFGLVHRCSEEYAEFFDTFRDRQPTFEVEEVLFPILQKPFGLYSHFNKDKIDHELKQLSRRMVFAKGASRFSGFKSLRCQIWHLQLEVPI
ncbi:MAG: hypothetical protein OHK0056_33400 [Bacteriovoracaceae bacterium]